MGYRFTLESANTVANLTFGKVHSCYRDIYSSRESYHEFMAFLMQFHENMYSGEYDRYGRRKPYYRKTKNIERITEQFRWIERHSYRDEEMEYEYPEFYDEHMLKLLYDLSRIFERCRVKSLLLPKMESNQDSFMTSEETLKQLVHIHPYDSCLILQPQEVPRKMTILDAFPNFDVALRQADLWPAVLFWEKDEYAFIHIEDINALKDIYKSIKFEKHPIKELKRISERCSQKSYYLFQLSDLHFGASNINMPRRRLKSLLESQLASISQDDKFEFLITGDALDSPKNTAEDDYRDFSEYLESRSGKLPILIPGNHDINNYGLAFFHGNQRLANIFGKYPKVKVLKDQKIILLLFNSNTNGNLAQGEIGEEQMAEMGNLLDKIDNLNDYSLIATMHHHLTYIPNPDHYDEKWYKKIIPKNFLEDSLKLIDADIFLEWLRARGVKVVLHGHKHIPYMTNLDDINIISCGSSTGQITHREKGKTFITYNLLKIGKEEIICSQFAEEIYGAGEKNIRSITIPLV